MKRLTIMPLAVSATLLTAFGCDWDFGEPFAADISGTWTFAADLSGPVGSRISCSASGYRLVVDQDDRAETFTGTYDGGTLTCVHHPDTILDRPSAGTIVNGTVGLGNILSSSLVSFDFDTRDAHQRGNVVFGDASSMEGHATWRIDFGNDVGSVDLTGSWEAVR